MSMLRGMFFAATLFFSVHSTASQAEEMVSRQYSPPNCGGEVVKITSELYLSIECEVHWMSPWNIPAEVLEEFEDVGVAITGRHQLVHRWKVSILNYGSHSHIYTPFHFGLVYVPARKVVVSTFLAPPRQSSEGSFLLTIIPRHDDDALKILTLLHEQFPLPKSQNPLLVYEVEYVLGDS